MDPDVALDEILALVQKMTTANTVDPVDGLQLADKVEHLDDWLSNGGFLPARWA